MTAVVEPRLRIRKITVPGGPRDAICLNRPRTAVMSQLQVLEGIREGWLAGEGHRVATRPAGPASDPWLSSPSAPTPHTFHQFDVLVIGRNPPVRYRVVRNPDKYLRGGLDGEKVTDDAYAAGQTDVVWHYDLELETEPEEGA